ncbi:ABC transporter substrate-binding protein, partial [Nonomuraea sp. NPDC003201]
MRASLARALAVPALLLLTAACGAEPAVTAAPVAAGKKINLSPDQNRVRADKVDAIAAQVPKDIAADGKLAVGFSGQGAAPLVFRADD